MRAAGEQEAVRSPEKVQQSSDYSLLQPTLNKNDLSNTINFLSGSCMWNEIMGNFENNPEAKLVMSYLELSMEEASYKNGRIKQQREQ
ncbi:hypothetical protein CEXT_267831 [Caerostris extrusa]|uniref:Uncharacterized protein n=1 Tax=Caerostris extrusa TaxID=172846 RepID=A0AAV4V214_CAEEX|nr:hypothetical protein CEXT_267831 [Caerostris extrusa]